MSSSPCLDTIRDAWEHLRPLIHHLVNQPSPAIQKAVVEELIKFDTILKGDLLNVVALFRETVYEESKAHDRTKAQLEHLRLEQARLHKELTRLTLPRSPPKSHDLDARMPSPIEPEDWHNESSH